jgi:hypothetical protein
MRCVGCGCTEDDACVGGCTWVGDRLCSRCVQIYSAVTEHLLTLARNQLSIAKRLKGGS